MHRPLIHMYCSKLSSTRPALRTAARVPLSCLSIANVEVQEWVKLTENGRGRNGLRHAHCAP